MYTLIGYTFEDPDGTPLDGVLFLNPDKAHVYAEIHGFHVLRNEYQHISTTPTDVDFTRRLGLLDRLLSFAEDQTPDHPDEPERSLSQTLDTLVHERAGEIAANVNNGGMIEQIEWLLNELDPKSAKLLAGYLGNDKDWSN